MTATALAIVVLLAGEADDPVAAPMARATEEALGARAQVVLRETWQLPGDDDAANVGRGLRAEAVVEVMWSDSSHTRAIVRVLPLDPQEPHEPWVQRQIVFGKDDAASERGRTLGFAAASMIPSAPGGPGDAAAARPEATTPAPPPHLSPPVPQQRVDGPPARSYSAQQGAGLLEALAVGTVANGEGPGVGGSLAGEVSFARHFGARLGGEARTATVPSVAATALTLLVTPGLTWRPFGPARGRPFAVGTRAEALLGVYALSHAGISAPVQWSPGVRALVDAAWMLGEGAGVCLAVGGEVPLRNVQVVEGTTTTYYPVRLVTELGIRAGF